MRAAQSPAAQQRLRRPPLQELRLQPGAERTSLTPLLRRLRLKDHDCATPVSCTRGPPGSVNPMPCVRGPPSSIIPEPPATPTLKSGAPEPPSRVTMAPCTLGPPSNTIQGLTGTPALGTTSNTIQELPGTPTLAPNASETPKTPTLALNASETPKTPTLAPNASETPKTPTPALNASETPKTPTLALNASETPKTPTLAPNASETPKTPTLAPNASETPKTPTLAPNASEPPGTPTLVPSASGPPKTPTPKLAAPESPSNPTLMPGALEPHNSTTLEPSVSPTLGPCHPEPLSSTVPAPLCSPIPGPSTLEPSRSTSSVPRTPNFSGSITLAPCTPGCPGSASPASCTPGPPGTSSTPQEAPFQGWRAVPADLSCSPMAPEPPTGDGSAGSLPCQGTPEEAEAPAPASPEQGSSRLACTEAGMSEPARLEATATPVPLPEATPGAVSWVLPLVWLEKSLNASYLLESLRHSLPAPWRDAGTSVTPVSTAVAGTSVTPVSTAVAGTSVTPVSTAVAGTSVTPVSTAVAGTSVTPVSTAVAGTSVTPVSTAVAGTSVTPVSTAVAGTSVTPVSTAVAGTSVTPVSTAVAGTFMTPRDLWERSMNTSARGPSCAKDSAAETDSLLWHCPREQLKSLPRAELEGRLESTLIIIEALSLQLRDWQENQRPLPGVGPAQQRDVLTQTDITHPKGEEEIYHNLYIELCRKTEALQRQRGAERDLQRELELAAAGKSAWSRQCLLFRDLVDAAFQSLQDEEGALAQEQEQARALVSRCRAVLENVPGKLRGCLEERDAMRQRAEEALRAKEEGDHFLEVFRVHASAQICARDQSLASQRELSMLLADAIEQQASLAAEAQPFREFIDVTFENLQEERRALDAEREQARALVSRCRTVLESLPGKMRGCLEERDATRQQADEALQAKEEASCQLEETSVALRDAEAQLEQLTVANSRLSADLSSLMTNLANVEQERDALQQENEKQWEEMAWLARERESLQRESNGLCQELREATECREFLDQENRMCRTQLLEVEAKLKSTLATLQERSLQCEELIDSHQHLREEQAALSKQLESTKAELLDLQLKRDKVSWCSADIAESKIRLQELADCLRAALEEEDDDAPSRSRAWTPAPRTPGWRTPGWQTPGRAWTPACRTPACRTPYRARSSFVGSVLKAVSGKDAAEAAGDGSTFTKQKPASTPKPTEPEDGLLESVKELRAVVSDLATLSSRIQELEQSEFKALQTQISDLQLRLETVTTESQEKMDAQAATIAKLNKALRGKLENEKELQDVVKQQEEKMLQLIDKSGEVTRLKGEISQLKRSLQRAESEAKVLWEEMRGKEPKVDTAYVHERVLLQQEVDKLRLLLLEKEDENLRLSDKYLEQVRGLELRLHHAQKVLRTHEEMQEKMKEVLSSVPDMATSCQELHSLLWYLGLKPASVSKEAAEPL